MRWSRSFIPTLKEDPQEAEAVSHKLMMRAGLIRRISAGSYAYLPMGYKVLCKVERIIREEMNRAGAVELLMPALHPVELWKQTGRYDDMGQVLIKYKDRHGREMALGPTHEEVVTDLVAKEVRSYKDLPLVLYQVQTKFRDETRPRFGVVRSCEFIMKDAYSFDVDAEGMEKNYKRMFDAYCRIFERCALPYIAVEANPGLMGGTVSHEFMVPAQIGEDKIIVCTSCRYAASIAVAAIKPQGTNSKSASPLRGLEEVSTPGVTTVEDLSRFLGVKPFELVKTLIYLADGEALAVLVRGDHEVNETKLKNYLKAKALALADEKKVLDVTGGPIGFSGPVGLSGVRILADFALQDMANFIAGSNENDKHLRNVNIDRDFRITEWIDARSITETDSCPKCGGKIDFKCSIEIGHTFKLGTKYSESLNAVFLDEKGRQRPIIMGCYGIGVNRILAALIESSHDKDGIIWPERLNPCEVIVIPVKNDDAGLFKEAVDIYERLKANAIDVILDDREKTAGVKFKDADLVGFPLQIIVGKKTLEGGKIEIKYRSSKKTDMVDKDSFVEHIKKALEKGQ